MTKRKLGSFPFFIFPDNRHFLIHPERSLREGDVHEGETVGKFQAGVATNGTAAFAVKPGQVRIDLEFVHHVHVRFARQARGGHLPEGDVDIVAEIFVVEADFPVDAAVLQQQRKGAVVTLDPVAGVSVVEPQARTHHDVEGKAHQGRLDFAVGALQTAGLGGEIMEIRNAFRRDGQFVHRQAFQVADAAAQGAVQDKNILGGLERRGHGGVDNAVKLIGPEKPRVVVHGVHQALTLGAGEPAKRRFQHLVRTLQLVEESLEGTEVAHDRVGPGTMPGPTVTAVRGI